MSRCPQSEILALTSTCKWYLYYSKNNVYWLIKRIHYLWHTYVPEKWRYTMILSAHSLRSVAHIISKCLWKDNACQMWLLLFGIDNSVVETLISQTWKSVYTMKRVFAVNFDCLIAQKVVFKCSTNETCIHQFLKKSSYRGRGDTPLPHPRRRPDTKCAPFEILPYYFALLSYLFHEVWLICFRMIHNWNSSNHASLSSIVFTKIECQKPFCATFMYMYMWAGELL